MRTKKSVKQLKYMAKRLLSWYENEENILLIDFFSKNGVTMNEVSDYAKTCDGLRISLERAMEIQKARLIMGGLSGKINQSFATYVLKEMTEPMPENPYSDLSDEELLQKAKELARKILQEDEI